MSDPFADFAGMTLGSDGGYQQAGGGVQQLTMLQPGQAPPAPMAVKDDPWGLVFNQNQTGGGQQPAAAPAINIMAEEPKAPTPVMNAPPMGAPGGAMVPTQTPAPGVMAGVAVAPVAAPAAAPVATSPTAASAAPPAAAPPPPPPADDGLPPGWTAYKDPSSGNEYYANAQTGQVTWEKPAPVALVAAPASAPPAAPQAAADPFSVFNGGAAPAPAAADPFGGGALQTIGSDVSEHGAVPENLPKEEDDFWAQMGFGLGAAVSEEEAVPSAAEADAKKAAMNRRKSTIRHSVVNLPNQAAAAIQEDNAGEDIELGKDGLPPGHTYDIELERATHRIGAVFLTAKQVKPTLYCKISDKVITSLGKRPIVAYMSASGAAHHANIEIGEILLAVNGKEAADPNQAKSLIANEKTPLTLKMHRPALPVFLGENQHMVKYDNAKPRAPTHIHGWKAKYVVVGGIAAKPYVMLMYYSKYEYDQIVAASLAKRHIGYDIKIKRFDLRGCKIVEDRMCSYPETHSAWHFFMIVPPADSVDGPYEPNIIKISHPNKEGLTPVLEAVRRVVKKYPTRPKNIAPNPSRGGGFNQVTLH